MEFKESINFGYSHKEQQQILLWIEEGALLGDNLQEDLSWKSKFEAPEADCIGKTLSREEVAEIIQYNRQSERKSPLLNFVDGKKAEDSYYPVIGDAGSIHCVLDILEMPLCANMLETLMTIAKDFAFLEMVVVMYQFEEPPEELTSHPEKSVDYLDFAFHICKGSVKLLSKREDILQCIRLYDENYGKSQ